jgi:hypothetical protein
LEADVRGARPALTTSLLVERLFCVLAPLAHAKSSGAARRRAANGAVTRTSLR